MRKLILFLVLPILLFASCSSKQSNSQLEQESSEKNLVNINNKMDDQETIGFLPLDSRTQTYDFPLELGQISGYKVISFPYDIMTKFQDQPDLVPGKKIISLPYETIAKFKDEPNLIEVRKWLEEKSSICSSLVISAEQLVYGGLIQAREAKAGSNERKLAIDLIKKIKQKNPGIKIYMSTILMRTSTTAFDEESLVWWEKTNEYSKEYYRANALNDQNAKLKLERLKQEIPEEILSTFISSRENNHELNKECINLVKDGIIEKLLICQEDCSEEGIQKFEQEILLEEIKNIKKIKNSDVNEKIFMSNGTNESGQELIMCAIRPEGCNLDIKWLGENTDFIAKYEDRAFKNNLDFHAKSLNIRFTKDSNNILFILPPKNKQGDYAVQDFTDYQPYNSDELKEISESIYKLFKQNKNCYLLDLDCANGGTINLLTELAKYMPVKDLCGYSAWNTASNSLGTILAQILASNGNNSIENKRFTQERIVDDCIYQSQIRQDLSDILKSKGENVFEIKNIEQANKLLSQEFKNQSNIIKNTFGDDLPEFTSNLRWPRLFEIQIRF